MEKVGASEFGSNKRFQINLISLFVDKWRRIASIVVLIVVIAISKIASFTWRRLIGGRFVEVLLLLLLIILLIIIEAFFIVK